ncbi:MAG: diacylglycerol kinase family lipid kinase [Dehalococcoidia bacterium]
MPYAKLIVNPTAGAGKTARYLPHILELMGSISLDFDYQLTESPGHAVEIAQLAVNDGYQVVISVGGDGTINEVVNGLYSSGNINNISLGIISTGTGADYIRTLGIPRPYHEAYKRFIDPVIVKADLGLVECVCNGQSSSRVFVNFAGLGFDAEIVRATTQTFKMLGDRPSYLMGLFSTLTLYKNRSVNLEIDGESADRKICTVMMSNGKYGGGGMLTAPNADPYDGLFDVVIIGDLSKPDLLWSLPMIYKGTHLSHPKVSVRRAKDVKINTEKKMSVQADGDLIGETPAQFKILPGILNVIT